MCWLSDCVWVRRGFRGVEDERTKPSSRELNSEMRHGRENSLFFMFQCQNHCHVSVRRSREIFSRLLPPSQLPAGDSKKWKTLENSRKRGRKEKKRRKNYDVNVSLRSLLTFCLPSFFFLLCRINILARKSHTDWLWLWHKKTFLFRLCFCFDVT